MTTVRKLSASFGDTSLPRLVNIDLIESKGSLLLIDMSKVEVPEVNGMYKNLFADQLHTLTGEDTAVQRRNYTNEAAANAIKVEVTGKGGLHYIGNPQVPLSENIQAYENIRADGGLKRYLINKQSKTEQKNLYFSQWVRFTRKGNKTAYPANMTHEYGHSLNRLFFMQEDSNNMVEGQPVLKIANELADQGSPPTMDTQLNLFNAGRVGLNIVGTGSGSDADSLRDYESVVFYRFYIEDLELSGRTHEEVEALDRKLFNEAFAPGGKFYGDTWTNPNTAVFS